MEHGCACLTAARQQVPEIMSMWADGQIRPHKVQRFVKTGSKFVYRVRCESGRRYEPPPSTAS